MKTFWISLTAGVAVYFAIYAWERSTHRFVRRIGSDGQGHFSSNTATRTEWIAFQPAWVLERMTRSLVWRVRNRKPLFGHVYWDGTEE